MEYQILKYLHGSSDTLTPLLSEKAKPYPEAIDSPVINDIV